MTIGNTHCDVQSRDRAGPLGIERKPCLKRDDEAVCHLFLTKRGWPFPGCVQGLLTRPSTTTYHHHSNTNIAQPLTTSHSSIAPFSTPQSLYAPASMPGPVRNISRRVMEHSPSQPDTSQASDSQRWSRIGTISTQTYNQAQIQAEQKEREQ